MIKRIYRKIVSRYPNIREWKIILSLKKILNIKNHMYIRKRNAATLKYGYEVISDFMQIAILLNIDMWLDWGTLLGYHRERALIGNDYDVDFATWAMSEEEHDIFQKTLEKRGYSRIRYTLVGDIYAEETYMKQNCYADVNFYYRRGNLSWTYVAHCSDMTESYYRNKAKYLKGLEICKFETENICFMEGEFANGVKCVVPRETERRVIEEYGESWKIPDPNYNWLNQNNYIREGFHPSAVIMKLE